MTDENRTEFHTKRIEEIKKQNKVLINYMENAGWDDLMEPKLLTESDKVSLIKNIFWLKEFQGILINKVLDEHSCPPNRIENKCEYAKLGGCRSHWNNYIQFPQ